MSKNIKNVVIGLTIVLGILALFSFLFPIIGFTSSASADGVGKMYNFTLNGIHLLNDNSKAVYAVQNNTVVCELYEFQSSGLLKGAFISLFFIIVIQALCIYFRKNEYVKEFGYSVVFLSLLIPFSLSIAFLPNYIHEEVELFRQYGYDILIVFVTSDLILSLIVAVDSLIHGEKIQSFFQRLIFINKSK